MRGIGSRRSDRGGKSQRAALWWTHSQRQSSGGILKKKQDLTERWGDGAVANEHKSWPARHTCLLQMAVRMHTCARYIDAGSSSEDEESGSQDDDNDDDDGGGGGDDDDDDDNDHSDGAHA